MRTEPLPSLAELVDYARKTWHQEFDSQEECFLDAFENGEYHEEEFCWGSLADSLPPAELGSLFLPVCRALIASEPANRDGGNLAALVGLFTALGKWQRRTLKTPEDLLIALDTVRPLVFKLSRGWTEAKYLYQMLDFAIRRRMGLSTIDLESVYALAEA